MNAMDLEDNGGLNAPAGEVDSGRWPFFVYAILPILFYWRWFATDQDARYLGGDFLDHYYSELLLLTERLKDFSYPLWDVGYFTGTPGMASMPYLIYPLNLLKGIMGVVIEDPDLFLRVIEYIHAPFHMTLAGSFTFILCHRALGMSRFASFMAGVSFMFCQGLIGASVSIIQAQIWPPLILYFYIRANQAPEKCWRIAIWGGIFQGISVTAGYAIIVIATVIMLLAYTLIRAWGRLDWTYLRRAALIFTVINLLGALISAISTIPTFELLQQSVRSSYTIEHSSEIGPVPILTMLNIFFPFFFKLNGTIWSSAYSGVAIPLFALAAILHPTARSSRNIILFILLLFLFLMLSWGLYFFPHQLGYLLIPFYDNMRHPQVLLSMFSLSLSILCGYGIHLHGIGDGLLNPFWNKTLVWLKALLAGIFALSLLLALAIISNHDPVAWSNYQDFSHSLAYFGVQLFIIYMFLKFLQPRKGWSGGLATVLTVVVVMDLFTVNHHYAGPKGIWPMFEKASPVDVYKSNSVIRFIQNELKNEKFTINVHDSPLTFSSSHYGISNRTIDRSLYTQRLFYQRHYLTSFTNSSAIFWDIFNVKYGIYMNPAAPIVNYDPSFQPGKAVRIEPRGEGVSLLNSKSKPEIGYPHEIALLENKDYLKKFRLHGDYTIFSLEDSNEYQKINPGSYNANPPFMRKSEELRIAMEKVDLRTTVFFEEGDVTAENKVLLSRVRGGSGIGTVKMDSYKPEEIILSYASDHDAILLAVESFYPGWEAELDGKPIPILRANYNVRAMVVPKGEHTVVMTFRPASVRNGLLLTLLGAMIAVIGLNKGRAQRYFDARSRGSLGRQSAGR